MMRSWTTANGWTNAVLTKKGLALMSKLTQGNTLNITRAVAGSGMVSVDELTQQEELLEPMQDMTIMSATYPETGKCAVTVNISNTDIEIPYMAEQIGFYADDPDEGEILYFIAQADEDRGVLIAAADEAAGYTAEWTFYFQYGQADSVTVVVDPANTVSRAVMEQYVANEIREATEEEIEEAILAALA